MPNPPPRPFAAHARHKAGGAARRLHHYRNISRSRLRHYRNVARSRIVGRTAPDRLYEAWVSARPATIAPGAVLGPPDPATITILMAVHDPPVRFLREALDSVLGQSAPVRELILSDDGSTDELVRDVLAEASQLPNVSLVTAAISGGIVRALNLALEHATGEYVGVLDHDDLLHPRAVEVMQRHLKENPPGDLVYSDEDKVSPDGRHFDPYFKPDYSPEMLLSSMYLNHFTVMRAVTVREVGAFREGTDGAQDHDLALRMIRAGATVSHAPGVLYHWRAWSGSTATGIQAKPWAQVAAADVQRTHLKAIGHPGNVEPSEIPGLNEVHPGIHGDPCISIIVPTASTPARAGSGLTFVEQCLRSIRAGAGWSNVEVVVVHTNEPDSAQRQILESLADNVVIYRTDSFNFSEACNLGAAAARGDYVLLLNDDTQILREGSIRAMLEFAQLQGVGAVGARLSYPNGDNQHSGMVLAGGHPTHPHHGSPPAETGYFGSIVTPRNYLAVTGAALMTPRALYERLGGLDAGWPHDYQDVDYCLRLGEAGYRIVYTPYAHFTHFESATLVRSAPDPTDTTLFLSRWGRRSTVDPYYSPLMDQQVTNLFSPL